MRFLAEQLVVVAPRLHPTTGGIQIDPVIVIGLCLRQEDDVEAVLAQPIGKLDILVSGRGKSLIEHPILQEKTALERQIVRKEKTDIGLALTRYQSVITKIAAAPPASKWRVTELRRQIGQAQNRDTFVGVSFEMCGDMSRQQARDTAEYRRPGTAPPRPAPHEVPGYAPLLGRTGLAGNSTRCLAAGPNPAR